MTLFYCSCGEFEKIQVVKEKSLFEVKVSVLKCKICGSEFTYINKNGSDVIYKSYKKKDSENKV